MKIDIRLLRDILNCLVFNLGFDKLKFKVIVEKVDPRGSQIPFPALKIGTFLDISY